MTATTHAETHAELHAEHCQWGSDLSLWRDDIGIWQKEMNLARGIDPAEEGPGPAPGRDQRPRPGAQRHAEQMKEHEYALANVEGGGPADNRLLLLTKKHRQEAAQHAQQREAHEDIKKDQHTLMVQWALVVKALNELV